MVKAIITSTVYGIGEVVVSLYGYVQQIIPSAGFITLLGSVYMFAFLCVILEVLQPLGPRDTRSNYLHWVRSKGHCLSFAFSVMISICATVVLFFEPLIKPREDTVEAMAREEAAGYIFLCFSEGYFVFYFSRTFIFWQSKDYEDMAQKGLLCLLVSVGIVSGKFVELLMYALLAELHTSCFSIRSLMIEADVNTKSGCFRYNSIAAVITSAFRWALYVYVVVISLKADDNGFGDVWFPLASISSLFVFSLFMVWRLVISDFYPKDDPSIDSMTQTPSTGEQLQPRLQALDITRSVATDPEL